MQKAWSSVPKMGASARERYIRSLASGRGTCPDPAVGPLLTAAGDVTGLNLLLLFGQDPSTCDTATGFARRLSKPVTQVRAALEALSGCGILQSTPRQGNSDQSSYWLAEDSTLLRALSRLIHAYSAGPDERRGLMRALLHSPAPSG